MSHDGTGLSSMSIRLAAMFKKNVGRYAGLIKRGNNAAKVWLKIVLDIQFSNFRISRQCFFN